MDSRRLASTRSMAPRLAILAGLLLTPSAALAQHHGGGGMHPGMGGQSYAHHNPEVLFLGEPAVWGGWGYGPGYYNNGYGNNAMGSMGMSPMDQEMFKQAQYMELYNRAQMNQMQAVRAQQEAILAQQASLRLARGGGFEAPPEENAEPVNVGLKGFVSLDRVLWPTVKTPDRSLMAKAEEAGKLLVEVHNQAVTNGFAERGLVSSARQKLGELKAAARKSTRTNLASKQKLARFIAEVDQAMDRSLRRPDADAEGGRRGRADQAGTKLAANR